MSFKVWAVILVLCILSLIAAEAKAMTPQEAYYEVGYEDGLDGHAPNTALSRNVAYRDGYNVGREQR